MDTMATILRIMKEKGITQKELCNAIGIGAPKFTDWKNGRVHSYNKYLPAIASYLNVSPDVLLGVTNAAGTGIKIPVLGKVQAGIPVEAIEDIVNYEEIPAKMAEGGTYFGLTEKDRKNQVAITLNHTIYYIAQYLIMLSLAFYKG